MYHLNIFATYQVDNTQQLFNGPAPRRCVAISDFIVTFSFSFDNSVVSWRRAAAWPGFYPTYVIARRVGRRLTGKSLQSTMQENKCVFCALIPYIYLCNIHKVTTNVSIIIDIDTIFEKTISSWAIWSMVMVLPSYCIIFGHPC